MSNTVVLRKEGKADYSLPKSFRPIALENTLSKILEAALASKITEAAEDRYLIPPSQMRARRKRSTLTAMELIDETIRTAWKYRSSRSNIVSMLSLDISGAYPNTSHPRLLYILRQCGYPEWLVSTIAHFLADRSTTLSAGLSQCVRACRRGPPYRRSYFYCSPMNFSECLKKGRLGE